MIKTGSRSARVNQSVSNPVYVVYSIYDHSKMIDLVYKTLKCLCSVAQTEWPTQKLVESEGCGYSRFGNILWLHQNLEVCTYQVDVRENRCSLECGREIM